MGLYGSGHDPIAGSCEHDDDLRVPKKNLD
jgi:hypothetical protein